MEHPPETPVDARPSSWDAAMHGPTPRPDWVVTHLDAVECDLGLLRTGKEADVHVVRRWVPGAPPGGDSCLMAAKRYRSNERRLFHRDAGYLEGRRVRKSRETRAMARRTAYGKERIAGNWAMAEFDILGRLWSLDLPVPYPVQFTEAEMLMELIGAAGVAAPRLAGARVPRDLLPELFEQLRETMTVLALHGWAHGDLSPYNILLDGERLVVIDWPQVVDIVGNPHGRTFLERDATTMAAWFTRQGCAVDASELLGDLLAAASRTW